MVHLGALHCNLILCDVYLEPHKPTYRHCILQFVYHLIKSWSSLALDAAY